MEGRDPSCLSMAYLRVPWKAVPQRKRLPPTDENVRTPDSPLSQPKLLAGAARLPAQILAHESRCRSRDQGESAGLQCTRESGCHLKADCGDPKLDGTDESADQRSHWYNSASYYDRAEYPAASWISGRAAARSGFLAERRVELAVRYERHRGVAGTEY
jgi:hypothetical protein